MSSEYSSRDTLTLRDKETYSLLTHKDPEGLLREYAGKGSPQHIRGGEPWETGYKEEVRAYYKKEDLVEDLKDKIREGKVIQFLLKSAEITEKN